MTDIRPEREEMLPTTQREPPREGDALRFFASHPLISLLGSLAGIIALPLAIYFYVSSIRRPKLEFYQNPATTTIVKAGESSDLHVLYGDKPVTTDVTGLQIAVWNAGKKAIHAGDILAPIVIKTSVPILEVRVRRVSREVTHFAIDTSKEAHGEVGLTWKILEHNDGAVVQLIVAGDQPRILYEGTVEGQRSLSVARSDTGKWFEYGAGIASAILGMAVGSMVMMGILQRPKPPAYRITMILLVGGTVLLAIIFVAKLFGPPSVPLPFS